MQSGPVISLSPSFNNYSSSNLADIAARVIEELRAEPEPELDDDLYADFKQDEKTSVIRASEVEEEMKSVPEEDDDDDDDDFAFPSVFVEQNSSPTPADEIFHNGQIRPVFPLFNTDLLLDGAEIVNPTTKLNSVPPKPTATRLPLRKLFSEERDSSSFSSSDGDELDGVQPETYCVWTPKPTADSKKSNSTGSSKRWKFRDLLYRSNSEVKDSFAILSHSNSNSKKRDEKVKKVEKPAGNVKSKVAAVGGEEGNYTKDDGGMKEGDRRRSYLPYKQDLVGFFANVNGLSRNLHPF